MSSFAFSLLFFGVAALVFLVVLRGFSIFSVIWTVFKTVVFSFNLRIIMSVAEFLVYLYRMPGTTKKQEDAMAEGKGVSTGDEPFGWSLRRALCEPVEKPKKETPVEERWHRIEEDDEPHLPIRPKRKSGTPCSQAEAPAKKKPKPNPWPNCLPPWGNIEPPRFGGPPRPRPKPRPRVKVVDIGKMTPSQADRFVERLQEQFRNKKKRQEQQEFWSGAGATVLSNPNAPAPKWDSFYAYRKFEDHKPVHIVIVGMQDTGPDRQVGYYFDQNTNRRLKILQPEHLTDEDYRKISAAIHRVRHIEGKWRQKIEERDV